MAIKFASTFGDRGENICLRSRTTPGEKTTGFAREDKREGVSTEYTDKQRAAEKLRFQSAVGCLLWVATRSRPDVAYGTAHAAAKIEKDPALCGV
eukprot:5694867-Amphidinium_carterae.1